MNSNDPVQFGTQVHPDTTQYTYAAGTITVKNAGWYLVNYTVTTPTPTPSTSEFALKQNATTVPGSNYGSSGTTNIVNGQAIVQANANDTLSLVNALAMTVTISSEVDSSVDASLFIERLSP